MEIQPGFTYIYRCTSVRKHIQRSLIMYVGNVDYDVVQDFREPPGYLSQLAALDPSKQSLHINLGCRSGT